MANLEERYIELINKDIDNLITESEKNELEEYLAKNKNAREYIYGLRLTNTYLDELPDPEPSENLKKQIINSINSDKYSLKPQRNSFWDFLFTPKFKLAYTFAVGLIVGIIIYAVLINNFNTVNMNDVYGTIGIKSDNINTVAEIPLNMPGLSGKIVLNKVNKNFWFNLNLNSSSNVDLSISFPENVEFDNLKLGNSDNLQISKGTNFISTNHSGIQQYSLIFSKKDEEPVKLELKIIQSGKTIYKNNLSLNN